MSQIMPAQSTDNGAKHFQDSDLQWEGQKGFGLGFWGKDPKNMKIL